MRHSTLQTVRRPIAQVGIWQRALRAVGLAGTVPIEKLRRMCLDVIDDVPPGHKQGLVSRISCLRRQDELLEIKPHLFAAVSRHHGEREARNRIDWLDSQVP